MTVLDRKHGVFHDRRNLGVVDNHAVLEREAGDDGAVVGVKLRHHVRTIVFKLLDARQVGGIDEDQPGERTEPRRQQQESQIGEFAEDLQGAPEQRPAVVLRGRGKKRKPWLVHGNQTPEPF